MRTHENLPALNKYTSLVQYETLKEINETNSIVKIVQQGRSSKTLGALIRCMWIKQKDYTDDSGVLREGWFVTEEGLHAMNLFAEKERVRQEEVDRIAEISSRFESSFQVIQQGLSQVEGIKASTDIEKVFRIVEEVGVESYCESIYWYKISKSKELRPL